MKNLLLGSLTDNFYPPEDDISNWASQGADFPVLARPLFAQMQMGGPCADCAAQYKITPMTAAIGVGVAAKFLLKKSVTKSAGLALATLLIATLWTPKAPTEKTA